MNKRLFLIVGLVLAVGLLSGCRFVAPVFEGAGGCPYSCHGGTCDSKSKAILRQWGQDARGGEQFVDQYFLNYDVNDPYRGDCVVGY